MSFQRTLTRFSVRAITPSGTSVHGLRVQSRVNTLEFSPNSTGGRFESFGRWSMNAAVAARPASRPKASRPPTTKIAIPARARRASLRWRSRRRLRASPGSAACSRRARRSRGSGRRLSGMRDSRQSGGRGAQLALRTRGPRRGRAAAPHLEPDGLGADLADDDVDLAETRLGGALAQAPLQPAPTRRRQRSRARAPPRRRPAACCSRSPSGPAARSGTRSTCRRRCAAASRRARAPRRRPRDHRCSPDRRGGSAG